jgi:hypothetical protein
MPHVRPGSTPDTGAGTAPGLRLAHLQEASGTAEGQASVSPRTGRRGGYERAAVKPVPQLPAIRPTQYPCCEGTENGCDQHRQAAALNLWFKPSRRGDFREDAA